MTRTYTQQVIYTEMGIKAIFAVQCDVVIKHNVSQKWPPFWPTF